LLLPSSGQFFCSNCLEISATLPYMLTAYFMIVIIVSR
jgi:hypothetical protein